jgi:hypothetical protein
MPPSLHVSSSYPGIRPLLPEEAPDFECCLADRIRLTDLPS